jgi:hypothetical protein
MAIVAAARSPGVMASRDCSSTGRHKTTGLCVAGHCLAGLGQPPGSAVEEDCRVSAGSSARWAARPPTSGTAVVVVQQQQRHSTRRERVAKMGP